MCLLGEGPPLIIMELCRNGNLLSYLRRLHKTYQARQRRLKEVYSDISKQESSMIPSKQKLTRTMSDGMKYMLKRTASELPWPVSVTDMLRMAFQVASGMEYLQSKKVCTSQPISNFGKDLQNSSPELPAELQNMVCPIT